MQRDRRATECWCLKTFPPHKGDAGFGQHVCEHLKLQKDRSALECMKRCKTLLHVSDAAFLRGQSRICPAGSGNTFCVACSIQPYLPVCGVPAVCGGIQSEEGPSAEFRSSVGAEFQAAWVVDQSCMVWSPSRFPEELSLSCG